MNESQADSERQQITAAERTGLPFLVYRDARGKQTVVRLEDTWERLTVGRGAGADVALAWDAEVSSVHAELVRMAQDWVLVDDGLSRNGTFVNGERVERRRRMLDGDEITFGETEVTYRAPFQARDQTTQMGLLDGGPPG